MSTLISKKVIVDIAQNLKGADSNVRNAVASFYNLLNSEMAKARKQETTLGWELFPVKATTIISLDKDEAPVIGAEITIGFNSSIMGDEYMDLFIITNRNKFRKDDPCEFYARVCYDLSNDPVKPSSLEDLTQFMKQYFKEIRRAIQNIWIEQVLGTMKLALGQGDEQDEPMITPMRMQSQQVTVNAQQKSPVSTKKLDFSNLDEMEQYPPVQVPDPNDTIPLPALRPPISPMQAMPTTTIPPISMGGKGAPKGGKPQRKGKESGSGGGILRRGKVSKEQDEFDISAKEEAPTSRAEEPIPSITLASSKQGNEKIIIDGDDEDEGSPPPIPKLPVLDSAKLKHS